MLPIVVGRTRGQQFGEKVLARLVIIGSYRFRIIVIEVLPDHLRIDPAVGGGIRGRIGRTPFRRAFGTGHQHQTRQYGKPPFQSVHNSGFNPTIPPRTPTVRRRPDPAFYKNSKLSTDRRKKSLFLSPVITAPRSQAALIALGFTGQAYVAPMQNQPMVRDREQFGRNMRR